ncbi:hypothetical protein R6Q59_014169 [Mikania micrantha]
MAEDGGVNGDEQPKVSHITVERNRRKQMNEHLTVLRSLMPCFYVKRGDQASIIGGLSHRGCEAKQPKLLQVLEDLSLEILQAGINTVEETMVNSFTIKIGIECQLSAEDLVQHIQKTFG